MLVPVLLVPMEEYRVTDAQRAFAHWYPEDADHMAHPYDAELETYLAALRDIPSVNTPLLLTRGEAVLQKTDIFKRIFMRCALAHVSCIYPDNSRAYRRTELATSGQATFGKKS